MVKQCCIRPNFCNGEKLSVYRFPSEKTEADSKQLMVEEITVIAIIQSS